MTDELLYERLALSVGRLHSPLPHVHGELIANANQLYPLLLAPLFAHGSVPASLHLAHVVNAFVMASACFPAFLLTRRVDRQPARRLRGRAPHRLPPVAALRRLPAHRGRRLPGLPLGDPRDRAVVRGAVAPNRRAADPRSARSRSSPARSSTCCIAVPPVAFFLHELALVGPDRPRRVWTALVRTVARRRVVAWSYAVVIAAVVVLAATGRLVQAFGTYGSAVQGDLLPPGTARSLLEHVAVLALGLGILPFVVGTAWLLRTLVRPSRRRSTCVRRRLPPWRSSPCSSR